MRFKIFDGMEVGFLVLALLAGAQVCNAEVVAVNAETGTGSRLFDASVLASSRNTAVNTIATTSLIAASHPAMTTYSAPTYGASAAAGHTGISAAPEVGSWTVIIAALGLVGMRLWRSGKKNLPAIK